MVEHDKIEEEEKGHELEDMEGQGKEKTSRGDVLESLVNEINKNAGGIKYLDTGFIIDDNFDSDYKVDGKENRSIGMDEISLPFETKQTQQFIEDAVDHSEVSRKLDRLILLLCTNEESLKHSELCEGE